MQTKSTIAVAAAGLLGLTAALCGPPAAAQEQRRPPAQQQAGEAQPLVVVLPGAVARPLAAPVNAYLGWAALFDPAQMGLSHTYTAQGFQGLHAALASIAEPGVSEEARQGIGRIATLANQLAESPKESLRHADQIHAAAMEAVQLVERIAQERSPADTGLAQAIASMRRAAADIDPKRPTLEQRAAVESFFQESVIPILVLATPPNPGAG